VDSFAWGILLAGIYVGIKASSRPAAHLARWGYVGAVSLAGCAVAFTVIPFAPQTMIQLERMLPGLAAFLLALFIFDPTAIGARILSTPALRFIGMVSYEWFLIHQPMMSYARWLVSAQGKIWNYALILAVPWVISFGLAVLIYFGFSLPIMRWGRNRLAARRKASTAPQAPVTDGVSANPS
jgi:peptidoglycan/LPS O-acetylase OafA/YrhL